MLYKASLDRAAIIITILVSLLFAALILFNFIMPLALFLLSIYLICFNLKPLRYELGENELIISRIIMSVRINISDIESLTLISKEKLNGTIRTFGVGGLFGWYGKFSNSQLGNMTWYLTRRDKAILIITKTHKKILISPDDGEAFTQAYNSLKT